MNFLFEFFPLILFLAGYLYKDIYFALIVLMIAMPIGLLVKYLRTKTWDKMYLWSTVLLVVIGGFTLYFRNPLFLYWKPTVFYWIASIVFLGSQFVGDQPLAQRFFGLLDGMNLNKVTALQWRRLNLVWVLFFVGMGAVNLFVAYNFEEATWVKFKVFGLMGLTFIFILGQTLWIANIIGDEGFEDQQEQD